MTHTAPGWASRAISRLILDCRRRVLLATGWRGLRIAAATALPAVLAACGFQPVYMPTASGKAGVAQRELSAVYVDLIPERPGQVLRQELQRRFGDDAGLPSHYDLKVSFGIAGEGIAIEANDLATRIRMIGNASWTLIARDGPHTTLTSGSARAMDGLNIIGEQYFAADLENEVVQQRIAQHIADQIATQLALWFRHRAAQQTTSADNG